ncbi:GspE/PulE family protein [Patescibacteria group bacterium]|nr:GspE/PulE family protein [Patescibacteria group bacterium]MCL5114862.1 GspE/PulE family protein [Patescibacteria group bacterium]
MINLSSAKLKDILVRAGVVDADTFDTIATEAERNRQNIADIVISSGLINKDYFYLLLSKSLGVERVNLGAVGIDEKALHLLPEDIARTRKAIVFGKDKNGYFEVAMENPADLETIDFLTLKLQGPMHPFLATEEDLNRGFILYQQKLTQDFKKIIEESVKESLRSRSKEGDVVQFAADVPIVAVVDNLMSYAISSRASDVHFEVLDDGILVRFRIDGILHEIMRMPKEIHPAIVARIKILSNLRVDEHTHPQDGRFRYKIGGEFIDVRVSIIPTFYGEKVEMRLLAAAQKPLSFQELGMFDDTVKLVSEAISKSYGMVLVCGPTGSGKTTTLYSFLNILNQPDVNIVTIEDPIEYDMRYINQTQVNVAAGITFASGLRSILRQDPNIIMVGEIRDNETADIAVQSSLTGHLVISSLHTNDSPTAIPRLIDMGIPAFLVSAVLNAVSSQRLVRRIHVDCIESYTPDKKMYEDIESQIKEFAAAGVDVKPPKTFYRGKGCAACNNTGFLGRIGIFEVLEITEKVRSFIIGKDFDLDNLRNLAKEEGMVTMFEDGLRKVELGMTTIEELFRVMRE